MSLNNLTITKTEIRSSIDKIEAAINEGRRIIVTYHDKPLFDIVPHRNPKKKKKVVDLTNEVEEFYKKSDEIINKYASNSEPIPARHIQPSIHRFVPRDKRYN